MLRDPSPEVLSALQLLRRGRFSDIVNSLEPRSKPASTRRRNDPLANAVLADALQRVGRNGEAENIARLGLSRSDELQTTARLHFVIGNVLRERGDLPTAIRHLQIAATQTTGDLELSCWVHLRLLATVAELSGSPAALARIGEVRRVLSRYGDARPFAALHLWHVEMNTMIGALDSARHHLRVASSLLSKVDDVWLHGYLAINSSVLHYYSAEVADARRSAEMAIGYARESGHRTTRRAAFANLGYFELSSGRLAQAEEYFQLALECSERGSSNELAILDNIAEAKLERGDFNGCRAILSQLEALASNNNDAHTRQYKAWALQTKIRLLLREGKGTEARRLTDHIQSMLAEMPEARLSTESRLLAAEALLSSEPAAAADLLCPIFETETQLAPDLFAEFERVSGKTLEASGSIHLARIHFERAAALFGAIGHSLGRERSLREGITDPQPDGTSATGVDLSLDRFRTLLEMRNRAELFGKEAMALLHELKCTQSAELSMSDGSQPTTTLRELGGRDHLCLLPSNRISIAIGCDPQKAVTLSFVPLHDPRSKLIALSFRRVISQLVTPQSNGTVDSHSYDVVWASESNASIDRGAVFASEAMLSILRTVKQISATDISVLITGETGTGKEIIAKTIHEHSRRSGRPFIAVNCSAVPRDLLESQLFGHRKGAFSGATDSFQGIVRAANGGTLFLDEVGEIPLEIQAKLLRFLEMNEVHPVGEPQPIRVDVRLIFATNGDLEEAVNHNLFRADLFYRMNVIPIKLPPLRERKEEIPILANIFAHRFGGELSKEPLRFSADAMERLIIFNWPGNIRQLANEIRRLTAVLDSGACVTTEHLSLPLKKQQLSSDTECSSPRLSLPMEQSLGKATAALEFQMIKHALGRAGGRVSEAAARLGISRKGLYLKRVRLGLKDIHSQRLW